MFDIFKLHETTLEEKSVNLNGNPSKASSNKTHFFQIGHQQNNQINGKESRSSNLLFGVLQKEKTSRKRIEQGNESDFVKNIETDLNSIPLKR